MGSGFTTDLLRNHNGVAVCLPAPISTGEGGGRGRGPSVFQVQSYNIFLKPAIVVANVESVCRECREWCK